MTDAAAVQIATDALVVAAKLAGPALLVTLVVGVFVSLIQTVTSIQEMTLTFVPKLVGVSLVLAAAGGLMAGQLVGFTDQLWTAIPTLVP